MKTLNPEMIEKVKSAKSAEEILKIAEANGVEMTADQANEYYKQITSSELDNDLLEGIAGGYVQEPPQKSVTDEHPDNYKSMC